MDVKTSLDNDGAHSAAGIDSRLTSSGLDLYSPSDLRDRDTGEKKTLRAAVQSGGWPTNEELRGKFIFVMSEKSSTYCSSDDSCNSCKAFRHCEFSDSDGFCVFYNEHCDTEDDNNFKNLYYDGFVSRCWRRSNDNKSSWNLAVNNKVHHIGTDNINIHKDTWSKTHNDNGWPFEAIDGTNVANNPSGSNVIGISVDSGDIWKKHDDFAFAHHLESTKDQSFTYTVAVNNANSDVNDWAKGGIMLRDDVSSKNRGESSRYFAVIRGADGKKLRVQYRSDYKSDSSEVTVDIDPYGDSSIDQESRCFLKLTYIYKTASNKSEVKGYGSQNGISWTQIYAMEFSGVHFQYHGLAGSSDGDSGNADGSKVKHLFTNFKKDGELMNANDLTLVKVGNDVSSAKRFNGYF